jgi:DNA-binding GntR family transcriptional regulator
MIGDDVLDRYLRYISNLISTHRLNSMVSGESRGKRYPSISGVQATLTRMPNMKRTGPDPVSAIGVAQQPGPPGVSMKERVYERLKVELLAGRLRPGVFLQEKQLAHTFGVSKTPIREALADLVKDRFVQLIPRKGYWVAPIEPQETLEHIELRIVLECAAVELAAKRITPAQLEALEKLTLSPSPAGRTPDREQAELYGRSNILFHRSIAVASGNRALVDALTRVLENLSRAIFLTYYAFPIIEEAAGDHSAIVEALRERDVDHARTVIKRHIETSRARLVRALVGTGDLSLEVFPRPVEAES